MTSPYEERLSLLSRQKPPLSSTISAGDFSDPAVFINYFGDSGPYKITERFVQDHPEFDWLSAHMTKYNQNRLRLRLDPIPQKLEFRRILELKHWFTVWETRS